MLHRWTKRALHYGCCHSLQSALSLYSIENSTIAITKLYSTSSPKPHAHILLDNNAQHEGRHRTTISSGRQKERHTCICASCIVLPKTRRLPGICCSWFSCPNQSEATPPSRLCSAGMDHLLWRTIRLDCSWSQLLLLSPVVRHASVALHPNEENCHVCWAHTANSASLTYCLWTHLRMNHRVQLR